MPVRYNFFVEQLSVQLRTSAQPLRQGSAKDVNMFVAQIPLFN
jgi:hypothetical protein